MRPETARVHSLVLAVDGWAGHRAGQHVDVRLTADDGYQAQRSYSIASAPDGPLTLTVERIDDGEVSPYLAGEARSGDKFELRGPVGGYFVWDAGTDAGPLLLVAGGSGVVPLAAMLRHRVASGSDVPVRLLSSSRSWDDVIYRDELAALAADVAGVEVVHTLTRSQPPGWTGFSRRIDAALLAAVAWPAAAFGPPMPAVATPAVDRPQAFVCGPTRFVEAVAKGLLALGYEAGRVRTERFGPTGG